MTSALKFLLGRGDLPASVEPAATGSRTQTRISKSGSGSTANPARDAVRALRQGPKHTLCRHQHSCVSTTLELTARAFAIGYVAQTGLKLFAALPSLFSKPRRLLGAFRSRDSVMLGAFLGSFVGLFKGATCSMRWIFNQDSEMQTAIAGFLAGGSMMFYKSSTIALYAVCKMAEILYFKGVDSGKWPKLKNADAVIYSLATAFVFHVAVFEAHNLRPSYWKFLQRLTQGKFSELNRHLIADFGTDATRMFKDWWPKYDPKYTSLARVTMS